MEEEEGEMDVVVFYCMHFTCLFDSLNNVQRYRRRCMAGSGIQDAHMGRVQTSCTRAAIRAEMRRVDTIIINMARLLLTQSVLMNRY